MRNLHIRNSGNALLSKLWRMRKSTWRANGVLYESWGLFGIRYVVEIREDVRGLLEMVRDPILFEVEPRTIKAWSLCENWRNRRIRDFQKTMFTRREGVEIVDYWKIQKELVKRTGWNKKAQLLALLTWLFALWEKDFRHQLHRCWNHSGFESGIDFSMTDFRWIIQHFPPFGIITTAEEVATRWCE